MMYNSGTANYAGNIYCYVNTALSGGVPVDTSKIRAMILDGNNRTLMAIYSVPADKTALIMGGYVGITKAVATTARITWRARFFGGVFFINGVIAINSGGANSFTHSYDALPVLPSKSDIIIRCESVTISSSGIVGGLDVILVDNKLIQTYQSA